jgi:simple sugar transport system permease protein
MAALASVVLAQLVERSGAPPWIAIAAVISMGAALGLVQGGCVVALGLPPFLVTLAGMFLFRGLALAVAAESIGIRSPAWAELASAGLPLGRGLSLRASGVLFLLVFLALAAVGARSRFFARLHAIGGDERAARLLGVPVARTKLLVYSLSGATAALAGVTLAWTASAGSSIACAGLELDAIAAAVIGGVALGPSAGAFTGRGRGHVGGALLGVLVFGVIADLVLFQGTLSAGWTRVATGAMLLLFLGADRALRARQEAR